MSAKNKTGIFLSLLSLRVSATIHCIFCGRCWFLRPVACQHGTKLHWPIETFTHAKYFTKFSTVKNISGEAEGNNLGRKWWRKVF